jgi:gas vesicle protein
MEVRTTYSTELLCFVVGGVTGAALALLWAPQSGKSTRETMGRKLRDTAGSARELKDRLVRGAEEIRDEAGRRLDQAASALAGDDAGPGTREAVASSSAR